MKCLLFFVFAAVALAYKPDHYYPTYKVEVNHDDWVRVYNPAKPEAEKLIFSFKEPAHDVEVHYQLVFQPWIAVLEPCGGTLTRRKDGTTLLEVTSSTSENLVVKYGVLTDHSPVEVIDSKRSRVCIGKKHFDVPPVEVKVKPIDCKDYSEADALRAIYFAAQGDEWVSRRNWLSGKDVCRWEGVDCEDQKVVRHLFLSENNLFGVLHPAIGCLKFLRTISVEKNHLFGTLPLSIEKLWESIQHLRVSKNHLRSPLPNLCSLKHLQFLYLDNNLFNELPLCKKSDWQFLKEIHADCTRIPFPTGKYAELIDHLARNHELFEVRWYCSDPNVHFCPPWYKELLRTGALLESSRCAFKSCECYKHPGKVPTPECPKHKDPVDPKPPKPPVEKCPECIGFCAKKCMTPSFSKCYKKRLTCMKNCYFDKCEEICMEPDVCPPERPRRVFVDIYPNQCPNDLSCRNLWIGGVVPFAILGHKEFDPREIDPATIRVWVRKSREAVKYDDIFDEDFEFCTAPYRTWKVRNSVSTPYIHPKDELYGTNPHHCTDEQPDEYDDLTFSVLRSRLCKCSGSCCKEGDVVVFKVTAELFDGREIEGIDVMQL
ncbi:hypothetical protein P9112_011054 [Eukaryota sp. TZLM1-RC]